MLVPLAPRLDGSLGRMVRAGASAETPLAVPEPFGLRASFVEIEGERLLVLSYPVPSARLPHSLTSAERDVALAMLGGRSNRAIARARGTAERTVANQVAAIYRKLGVRSRTELGRRLAGARP